MAHKGFSAHTPAIHGHAERVGQRGDQVSEAGSRVSGAGLPGGALGAVGESVTGGHQQLVSRMNSLVSGAGSKLRGQSDVLHRNADNISDVDQEHAGRFRNIAPNNDAPQLHRSASDPGPRRGSGSGDSAYTRFDRRIGAENTDPRANDTRTADRTGCGDPIDVSTGRVMITETDVELDSLLRLVLSRTHLSGYALGRSFGAAWACTLDQRVEVESGVVHFAAEDGMLLRYPLPGPDAVVRPESGAPLSLSRDGDGFAIVDHQANQVLVFAPSSGNRFLLSVIAGPSQFIEIRRDATGIPVEVAHSAGPRVAVDSENGLVTGLRLLPPSEDFVEVPLTRYRYDDQLRLTEVYNSSGQPLRYEYDANNRVVGWTDRNDTWYRYEFDGQGRCVQAEGTDGYQNYTFEYDRAKLITRATNSLGDTTVFQLDEGLRVIGETNPLGHTTTSTWDQFDRLLSRTDPMGRTTRFEYDGDGNLTATTFPDGSRELTEYNALGQPVTVVAADGAVWRWEHDDAGRITAAIDPVGARTEYRYGDLGELTAVTDPLGNTTRIEVNELGLPATVTDPLGRVTRYDYDLFGRPGLITDALGGTTLLTWTPEGQQLTETFPNGETEYQLTDGEGNATVMLDAQGELTRTEYGRFDLPVAEVGADGTRLEYRYDTELRLVAVTNQQGQEWRYEYDAAGNVVREADFLGRELRYTYDAAGELVERINAEGQSVVMERDLLGRTVRRISDETITSYQYDPVGRITRASNEYAELVMTYDPAGRVLTETVNGRTVHSRYDAAGHRIGRRTPTGASAAWEFDAADQVVALHTAGQTLRFGYDAGGRETRRQLGAGVTVAQQWGAGDLLREQALFTGGETPAQRRTYGYRPDGVLAELTDQLSGPRRFDLDPSGRVTAVHRPQGSERYRYDPAGNLVHADLPGTAEVGDREYANGLLVRAGAVYYGYDAEGRVVSRQWRDEQGITRGWRYRWDGEDRLVETYTPDGQRWRYRYDPLGRRIAKLRLGDENTVLEVVEFHWDGDNIAEQVRDARTALVWDWAPNSFVAIGQAARTVDPDGAQWTDSAFHAIVADQIGAPRELVSPDGAEVWHLDTTLWGRPRSTADAARTPLRFPGQFEDPETGLYYNFHRHYDPAVAGYATTDPLGLEPGPNARAYVVNPTVFTDPLGLMPSYSSRSSGGGRQPGRGSGRSGRSRCSANGGSSSSSRPTRRPAYQTGRYNGPTQVAPSGSRVPIYDNTHAGLYPRTTYVQYAGQHRYTNQYSVGNHNQSEHVYPSQASRLAGIPGYNERYEPTVSIPTRYHQPRPGAGGLGGHTVSSTGSGYVPSNWAQRLSSGVRPSTQHPSGYSYYHGLSNALDDEMNVHHEFAPGGHQIVQDHYQLGRLTQAERDQLQARLLNRFYQEHRR